MKYLTLLVSLFTLAFSFSLKAQSGQETYRFLELPVSSHIAALGGLSASFYEEGISAAMGNPALLSSDTDNQVALNFTKYLADVSGGTLAYGKNWHNNLFGIGIQFVDYGNFDRRDEFNQDMGSFQARDFALSLQYARLLDKRWTLGVTLKPIYSSYENYSSFGMGVDLGIAYTNKEDGLAVGASVVNIGRQFTSYASELEYLPFNSMISLTKKFRHAPFRIHVTAHHLHVWDLDYDNNIYTTTLSGEKETKKINFVDMLFRHTIFGVDFTPGNRVYLTASYNHRRAAELGVEGSRSITGFSFGGGVKIYKFQIGFALSQYQKGVMSYQFSLSTDLKSFKLQ